MSKRKPLKCFKQGAHEKHHQIYMLETGGELGLTEQD